MVLREFHKKIENFIKDGRINDALEYSLEEFSTFPEKYQHFDNSKNELILLSSQFHANEKDYVRKSHDEYNQIRNGIAKRLLDIVKSIPKEETNSFDSLAKKLIENLGCREISISSRDPDENDKVNNARNDAKKEAIQTSHEVMLIAETGYSYFGINVGRFFPQVSNLISSKGGRFRAVLMNPDFIEAHSVSKSYVEKVELDNLEEVDVEKYIKYGFRPEISPKKTAVISGIKKLESLDKNNKIEIKYSRYGLPATILITDKVIFYEPYFRTDRGDRDQMLLDTFEFQFESPPDRVRKMFVDNFEFYFKNSDSIAEYHNRKKIYREVLQKLNQEWK